MKFKIKNKTGLRKVLKNYEKNHCGFYDKVVIWKNGFWEIKPADFLTTFEISMKARIIWKIKDFYETDEENYLKSMVDQSITTNFSIIESY